MVESNKEITIKRKQYSEDFLISKTNVKLRKFCQKNKIPFMSLTKIKMVQNIIEWSSGITNKEEFTNRGLTHETRPTSHKLSIKQRRFCFEYSTQGSILTQAKWGKRFGVESTTISKWLSWDETKALIETFQYDYEKRVLQRFADEEEGVVTELMKIINQKRNSDVKRKAINDFFGLRGRVNVNEKGGTQVNVKQQQQSNQATLIQNNVYQMTEEDIIKELKELENMES